MVNQKEVTKAELSFLMHVSKLSDNHSEWWFVQGSILKSTTLAQTAASQYKSLGATGAVRASRDNKGQRLEHYCKALTTLRAECEKSDALSVKVGREAKPAMDFCAVAEVCFRSCFDDSNRECLEQGIAALFDTHRTEIKGILSSLDSHTMQYEVPEETWKSWQAKPEWAGKDATDKEFGDMVMTTAAATIATLKGGLINNDFKNLEQALTSI